MMITIKNPEQSLDQFSKHDPLEKKKTEFGCRLNSFAKSSILEFLKTLGFPETVDSTGTFLKETLFFLRCYLYI